MHSSVVSSKGQVVIPKEIRDLMRVKTGDRIDFVVDECGGILIRHASQDVRRLKSILPPYGGPAVSVEEMDEAIARGATGSGDE